MDIKNLISFIRYGVDSAKTREKMILGAVAISIFSMFACMDCFIYDTLTLVCAIIIFLLSIAFIVILSIVARVLNMQTRVKCDAIITIFTVAICSLTGTVYFYMNEIPYSFLLLTVPFIFAIISFLNSYVKVKKNKYITKTNNPNYLNLAVFTGIGAVLGYVIMQRYYDQISEFISMDILIGVLFLMIAIIFAVMGAPSFLKLYYLKELNATGINLDV